MKMLEKKIFRKNLQKIVYEIVDGWRRIRMMTRVKKIIILHAISIFIILFFSVFLLDRIILWSFAENKIILLLILVLYLLILVFPYFFTIVSLWLIQVDKENKKNQLSLIVLSYVSIIFVFAGGYYTINLVHDYNRTVSEFFGYIEEPAFSGIELRLFTLGDQALSINDLQDKSGQNVSSSYFLNHSLEEEITFQPVARFGIFSDCLYLSITTMTLFGYGAILPLSPYARLVNGFQQLTAVFLLVVSLGRLFADW